MAVAMDAPNEKMTTMKSTMLYLQKIIRKINKKEKKITRKKIYQDFLLKNNFGVRPITLQHT